MSTSAETIGHVTFTTPSERELVASFTVEAPRERVFDAFTSPRHLPRWLLGPDGWSMPVCDVDLRPEGAWRYVWHRDGGDEEFFMSGLYREVVPPERVTNTERFNGQGPEAVNTAEFADAAGATTVTLTMRYPSPEVREAVVATGMKSGMVRSFERLADYLRAPG